MRLNLQESGHQPDNTDFTPQWWINPFPPFVAYWDPYGPKPTKPVDNLGKTMFDILASAVRYLDLKVQQHTPCNECFRRLPGKRSFKEVYNDPDVWINYNGAFNATYAGFTRKGSKEIVIHSTSIMKGHLFVAATLVHEMAHVNGASGSGIDQSAEKTLKACLLPQMFNPNVYGAIDRFVRPGSGGTVPV